MYYDKQKWIKLHDEIIYRLVKLYHPFGSLLTADETIDDDVGGVFSCSSTFSIAIFHSWPARDKLPLFPLFIGLFGDDKDSWLWTSVEFVGEWAEEKFFFKN